MCVVELASARELLSASHPHGFRFPDGKVIWDDATAGRGKLIRIQRRGGRSRYVSDDTLFEIVPEFDLHGVVFSEPVA